MAFLEAKLFVQFKRKFLDNEGGETMQVPKFLEKPLLPYLIRIMEVVVPMASITGFILMPRMMAAYPFASPLYWTCLVLSVNAWALPFIALANKENLDWAYSCYLTITVTKVFRGGQLTYRPSKRAIVTGASFAITTVVFRGTTQLIFSCIALPFGIFALVGLLLVVFWYVWMSAVNAAYQGEIEYAYWVLDPQTGQKTECYDHCHAEDLGHVITMCDLELLLAERRQELGQDAQAAEAVETSSQRAVNTSRGGASKS